MLEMLLSTPKIIPISGGGPGLAIFGGGNAYASPTERYKYSDNTVTTNTHLSIARSDQSGVSSVPGGY